MAMHHLSINVTKNVNIGVFESVMFRRENTFELQYLNPIIFYRSIEQALGSPDNAFIGFDFKVNIPKHVQIYSQFLLDEFNFKKEFSTPGKSKIYSLFHPRKWWGNKFAAQLGIKYIDAFDVMEARLREQEGRALSPRQQPQLPLSSPSPSRSVLPVYIEAARPIFHYPLESQFSDQEKLGFTRAGAMTVILQTTSHLLKKEMNSPLRKILYQIVQENMGDVRGCIEELDCLYFQLRSMHTHVESFRNLSNEMQSKVERLMNEGRTIVVKKG
jgi:hypothetical protein